LLAAVAEVRPPRHTWRAGARAPPGRHFGNDVGEADKALHGLVYRGSSDGVLLGSLLIGESDCSASAATAREQRSHRLLRRLQPHQTPARGRVEAPGLCRRRTLIVAADDRRRPSFTHPTVPVCSAGRSGEARVWQASPSVPFPNSNLRQVAHVLRPSRCGEGGGAGGLEGAEALGATRALTWPQAA